MISRMYHENVHVKFRSILGHFDVILVTFWHQIPLKLIVTLLSKHTFYIECYKSQGNTKNGHFSIIRQDHLTLL